MDGVPSCSTPPSCPPPSCHLTSTHLNSPTSPHLTFCRYLSFPCITPRQFTFTLMSPYLVSLHLSPLHTKPPYVTSAKPTVPPHILSTVLQQPNRWHQKLIKKAPTHQLMLSWHLICPWNLLVFFSPVPNLYALLGGNVSCPTR